MYDFNGKRALVTGGSAGIGKEVAIKLLECGAQVFVVGRNQTRLQKLKTEYPNLEIICNDVGDWTSTREILGKITPIHLLVNNAGISVVSSALNAKPEDFDDIFRVNVKAIMNITQVVAKDLVTRTQKGNIVNVSSQASQRAFDDHLIYCSSKAAVDMMTKVFAKELGPHNIRVNAVNPTVVMTEMGKKHWSDPVKAQGMLNRIPLKRFAEVSEVVNVILFLLSDQSEMINGHCLPVDGGLLAA